MIDLILFFLPLENPLALYAVLFGMIFTSVFGVPIPEEITVLLGGYLAYLGFIDFFTVAVVLIASIVVADLMGYALGRYAGDFLYNNVFGRFEFTRELLEKTKTYFDRFGEKMILATRLMSGVRFVVPIMAGHFRMNVKKFLIYDIIAAIPYTFILIFLSYYLGSLINLTDNMRSLTHTIGWIIGGMIVIALIVRYIKKRRLRIGMKQ